MEQIEYLVHAKIPADTGSETLRSLASNCPEYFTKNVGEGVIPEVGSTQCLGVGFETIEVERIDPPEPENGILSHAVVFRISQKDLLILAQQPGWQPGPFSGLADPI